MNELVRIDPSAPPPALEGYLRQQRAREEAMARRAALPEKARNSVFVPDAPDVSALSEAERDSVRDWLIARGQGGPVTGRLLASWLAPINAQVAPAPLDDRALANRCIAMATLLDDLPASVLTHQARRRLPTKWFPSCDDVRAAVRPEVEAMEAQRAAAEAILARPKARAARAPEAAQRGPRTVEEVMAVRGAVAALQAEMAEREAAVSPPPSRRPDTRPLPGPLEVLGMYEPLMTEKRDPLAATRCAAAYRKLLAARDEHSATWRQRLAWVEKEFPVTRQAAAA